jgi:hypothetical protein
MNGFGQMVCIAALKNFTAGQAADSQQLFLASPFSTYYHRHKFFLHQKLQGRLVHGRGFCPLPFPGNIHDTIYERDHGHNFASACPN